MARRNTSENVIEPDDSEGVPSYDEKIAANTDYGKATKEADPIAGENAEYVEMTSGDPEIGTDVAAYEDNTVRVLTDEQLHEIKSFDDLLATLQENQIAVVDHGDGFEFLNADDKARLKGVPFIVVKFGYREDHPEYGSICYVSVVTKNNEKFRFNDTSRGPGGIFATLKKHFENSTAPYAVPKGLFPHSFQRADGIGPDGKPKTATVNTWRFSG